MSRSLVAVPLAIGLAGLLVGACEAGSLSAAPVVAVAVEPLPLERVSFRVVVDRPLPAELRWAFDVRWGAQDRVLVVAGRSGVFELNVTDPDAPPRRIGSGGSPDGLMLATSGGIVAAGRGSVGYVGWIDEAAGTPTKRAVPMSEIVDFDLWRERAIFLGARRDEEDVWAPEGAILWAGSIEDDFEELEPRMYAASGAGASEIARCGVLEIGAVRFFPDGRYAVVPGVQPGAFLYAADGRLLHAWETAPLGIYDECDLDWVQARDVSADLHVRLAWFARQPILDDLVAWGEWPAVLLRHPRSDGTSWRMAVLSDRGVSEPFELPIATGSTGSRLRGDVRGHRLALLVLEFGGNEEPPQAPPRLVVLEVSSAPPVPAGREEGE